MQLQIVIFSALSFWGHYLMYRAVCIAIPNANRPVSALLMLFFPSVVFWSATLGKDSLMILAVSMVVYGFANFVSGGAKPLAGYIAIILGMAGGSMIRPHVIGLAALSIAVPYISSRNRMGPYGAVVRLVGIPLLIWGSVIFFRQATEALNVENISQGMNLMNTARVSSSVGGSGFGASITERLVLAPFLIFRPFIWEVRNVPGAVAGIEGLLLVGLVFGQFRHVLALFKKWRDIPLVTFAFIYSVSLSFIFSTSMSNLGTIARQRAVILPLVLVVVVGATSVAPQRILRAVAIRPLRRFQKVGSM
jgi:hypothetical protein